MEVLDNGSWQLDSALEADIVGRVAAYGRDDAQRLYLSHKPGQLEHTHDEVEFLNRTLKYGALVVSREVARRAERGLNVSAMPRLPSAEQADQLLPPDIANAFLGAIALSKEMLTENETPVNIVA